MKKTMLIGFLAIAVLISGCVGPKTEIQPSAKALPTATPQVSSEVYQTPNNVTIPDNLTEEQKLIVKIALSNSTVKEMLKGKEVKISSVGSIVSGSTTENGKEISFNLPSVQIYIGSENWTSAIEIIPLVDLKEKRVVRILKGPYVHPDMIKNLT